MCAGELSVTSARVKDSAGGRPRCKDVCRKDEIKPFVKSKVKGSLHVEGGNSWESSQVREQVIGPTVFLVVCFVFVLFCFVFVEEGGWDVGMEGGA